MSGSEENFGQRMARVKRENGLNMGGRPRIVDKHSRYVNAAERIFAVQLPEEAQRYVDELVVKEPETCPNHGKILHCSEQGCTIVSQRTRYDHKAAQYIFDRIQGKPTTRSENVITVRLVQELTAAVVMAFSEVNTLEDADTRREAFAGKLVELGAHFGGAAA